MPSRLWDITHLDLDVRLDLEAGTVRGTTTHTLEALGRPRDRVRFHQIGLTIASVTVDGTETTDFRLGPEWIDIPIPPSGDTHEVRIAYTATPPLGLHFRGPAHGDANLGVWSQGEGEDNRYWFPNWDYPNEAFSLTTHVTVRDGLLVRANGDPTGSEPAESGWTKHSFDLQEPITGYMVALVAGDYRAVEVDGRIPLEIVGPAVYDDAWLRVAAEEASEQLDFFEALLDREFPYPSYRQAWVQRFMYGGMENPGLTVLASRRMVDPENRDRQMRTDGLIAHELAHQWFGDLLTCYGWRELWLNEGFATYYAHLWLEEKYGPDYAGMALYSRRERALAVKGAVATRAYSHDGRDNHGVYVKGGSVLHQLRTYLGKPVYDAAIRRYVAENGFRFVESEDLRRAFEDESGEHLGWLFDQWVYGTGIPTWKSVWTHSEGQLTVTVTPAGDAVFHAPLDIEVGTADGTRTHRVWLDAGPTKLVVDAETAPLWVSVNANAGVLGVFDQAQTPESWVHQLERSPSTYAQVVAMHRLKELDPTPETVAALDRILRSERLPEFRAIAAEVLGTLATLPAAQESLVRASSDANAIVRQAAIDAMGNTEGGDAFADRLAAAHRDDSDAVNRGQALLALAKHDGKRAAALARKALGRSDDTRNGDLHRRAAQTLAEHGDLADGAALARLMRTDRPRGVRYAAADAAVVRFEDAEESAKRTALQKKLAERFLTWLDDPDYRIRSAAIRALGTVGRQRDIAALQGYAKRDVVKRHDEQVAAAIRKIRTPEKVDDPVEALRKRVDALSDRVDEATGRIERLEEWRD